MNLTRPRSRAVTLVVTSIVVLVAAGVAVFEFTDLGRAHGSLKLVGDSYNFCYHPPTAADREMQAQYGQVFGLDAIGISSLSTTATVTAVTMLNPTEGIILRSVAFVPGTEVGIGTPGNKGIYTSTPSLAKLAEPLPAKLTRTDQPNPKVWELAVTLSAPETATKAHIDGFLLTYKTGSSQHTLKTRDTVTLGAPKC